MSGIDERNEVTLDALAYMTNPEFVSLKRSLSSDILVPKSFSLELDPCRSICDGGGVASTGLEMDPDSDNPR